MISSLWPYFLSQVLNSFLWTVIYLFLNLSIWKQLCDNLRFQYPSFQLFTQWTKDTWLLAHIDERFTYMKNGFHYLTYRRKFERTLQLITDVNIAVAVEAIQAIGNISRGLRANFSASSRFLLPVLLVCILVQLFLQLIVKKISIKIFFAVNVWMMLYCYFVFMVLVSISIIVSNEDSHFTSWFLMLSWQILAVVMSLHQLLLLFFKISLNFFFTCPLFLFSCSFFRLSNIVFVSSSKFDLLNMWDICFFVNRKNISFL